jgi:pimeloyl-ACP methyl ester carboxylesterase
LLVLIVLGVAGFIVVWREPLWAEQQWTHLGLFVARVQSNYVLTPEGRVHYYEGEPRIPGGGVPLVLVHGLGDRDESWAPMLKRLKRAGFHVYAPDLLGYGRSPRPDVSYSISMEEAVVVQFMQAVHLTRADVGGWSMGGWVAMKLALDHPEMVDRLMIYDSAGIYFPATFGPELFTPDDVAGVRRLMSILTPKPIDMPEFAAKAALRKLQRNAWILNRSTVAMMSGFDLLDFRLQNLRQPMLIVWGAQDELIPLSVGETIHRDVPHSVLDVVEGCGHLAPLECAKPVLEGTVAFLRAQPPLQGGGKTFPGEH